ncbi:MAG TPA: carboxypeptidase-like regulatory domain-containing protein, partial [Candidatus Acidoferrales bacterium]|nr:carboxypeptidase-like regulatory domain-containing protein [Candidatus Acidoferrales bacterium]
SPSGLREITNRADGTFVVVGCAPGKNFITASAKGYAPMTLPVDLTNDSPPIQMTLQPGKLLVLQVVDTNGFPIPKADVRLDPFGYMNPTSPPPEITFGGETDPNGHLEWNSAPDRNLVVGVSAAGYMRKDRVEVLADGIEHVVTLQPALTISGTVRDATSGRPIPRFHIVTGWPNWDSGYNGTNVQWSTLDRFWLSFDGGKFRHAYEEPVVRGAPDLRFVFKFEADGFAPFVTRQVAATEHDVQFDVALNPAVEKEITVLQPDGGLAVAVDIGLVLPGSDLFLIPGGFSQSRGSLLSTDDHGRFQLPPDPAIKRVIAAGSQGYVESTLAQLATDPVMHMRPWGRLEGTYLHDGHPVAGAELQFEYNQSTEQAWDGLACDFYAFETRTDSSGRFVFPKVPEGDHEVMLVTSSTDPVGNISWTPMRLQRVTIRSGETTTITIDGSR